MQKLIEEAMVNEWTTLAKNAREKGMLIRLPRQTDGVFVPEVLMTPDDLDMVVQRMPQRLIAENIKKAELCDPGEVLMQRLDKLAGEIQAIQRFCMRAGFIKS